jgi:hypothetical protein
MPKPLISKSLSQLIDEAILPAVLMVAAKIIGVLLVSLVASEKIIVSQNSFLKLPVISHTSYQSYYLINTWSNAFMFAVAAIGAGIVIIKAHFFHESHIKPSFHAKLARLKLSGLVVSTFRLYHQAAIWLMFLWLVTSLLLVEAFLKSSSAFLATIAFLVSVNSTWFLISDVEHELEIWREQHPNL